MLSIYFFNEVFVLCISDIADCSIVYNARVLSR